MDTSCIHPLLEPLNWLEGTWVTKDGQGKYPTIKSFSYGEKLQFQCIGQPMFIYSADSWHPETKKPMHIERGFLRIRPNTDQLNLLISHNFGLTTIEEGTFTSNKEITLTTRNISRISFAKDPAVKAIKRSFKLIDPNKIEVTLFMETDNTPMTEHLKAIYIKEIL